MVEVNMGVKLLKKLLLLQLMDKNMKEETLEEEVAVATEEEEDLEGDLEVATEAEAEVVVLVTVVGNTGERHPFTYLPKILPTMHLVRLIP